MALPTSPAATRPPLLSRAGMFLARLLAVALLALPATPAGASTPTPTRTATSTAQPAVGTPTPSPASSTASPGPSATGGAGGTPSPTPTVAAPAPPGPHLGQGQERFLLVNQHGGLFYESDADLQENAAYAAWLGASAIRVFATDSNTHKPWDGKRVGRQIVRWAPHLRPRRLRLVVALVNNHRPVPGEAGRTAPASWKASSSSCCPSTTSAGRGPTCASPTTSSPPSARAGRRTSSRPGRWGTSCTPPRPRWPSRPSSNAAISEVRKVDAMTPDLARHHGRAPPAPLGGALPPGPLALLRGPGGRLHPARLRLAQRGRPRGHAHPLGPG